MLISIELNSGSGGMKMTDSILQALGVEAKEDIISNLIAHCINISLEFGKKVLDFCEIDNPEEFDNIKAFTRVKTSKGIPDIVIKAECTNTSNRCCIVIIENKLNASEGVEQTKRYSDIKEEITSKMGITDTMNKVLEYEYIYLALYDGIGLSSPKFKNKIYKEFKSIDTSVIRYDIAKKMMDEWCRILDNFYKMGNPGANDPFLLDPPIYDPLGSSYLRFLKIFDGLTLPQDLEKLQVYRGEANQGLLFGYMLTKKESWIIENNHWNGKSDPSRLSSGSRNIHIELQIDETNRPSILSVMIHYETEPYLTNGKILKAKIPEEDLKDYKEKREKFIDAIRKNTQLGEFSTGRSYKLTVRKCEIDMNKKTLMEIQKEVSKLINKATCIIDQALLDINQP